jgi:hypothetical protein
LNGNLAKRSYCYVIYSRQISQHLGLIMLGIFFSEIQCF